MSWLRMDDGFVEHPKVVDLSDRAFRLHVTALCYCARNLTDGILVERAVRVVCAASAAAKKHVSELTEVGLWTAIPDGFAVKDFLEFNPSAEQVKEERAKARDRMRRVRAGRSAERSPERSGTPSRPHSSPEAVTPTADDAGATGGEGTASDFPISDDLLRTMPA